MCCLVSLSCAANEAATLLRRKRAGHAPALLTRWLHSCDAKPCSR